MYDEGHGNDDPKSTLRSAQCFIWNLHTTPTLKVFNSSIFFLVFFFLSLCLSVSLFLWVFPFPPKLRNTISSAYIYQKMNKINYNFRLIHLFFHCLKKSISTTNGLSFQNIFMDCKSSNKYQHSPKSVWTEREYNNPFFFVGLFAKGPPIFPVSMFVTFVKVEIESKSENPLGLKLILVYLWLPHTPHESKIESWLNSVDHGSLHMTTIHFEELDLGLFQLTRGEILADHGSTILVEEFFLGWILFPIFELLASFPLEINVRALLRSQTSLPTGPSPCGNSQFTAFNLYTNLQRHIVTFFWSVHYSAHMQGN